MTLIALFSVRSEARAQEYEAIYSKVSHGYVRAKLPDGSAVPETYSFKEGEYWGGDNIVLQSESLSTVDDSLEKMSFGDVSRVIAVALAKQRYVPSSDPGLTKLMIVVNWGMTAPPSSFRTINYSLQQKAQWEGFYNARDVLGSVAQGQMDENSDAILKTSPARFVPTNRDQAMMEETVNSRNASELGYNTPRDGELLQYRYFVVLKAFDFRSMSGHRRPKLLWETRFSITKVRNQFDKRLAAMALGASGYFGHDSNGLRHESVEQGRVEIGEIQSLGFLPEPDRVALAPDGARVAYLRTANSRVRLVIADVDRPESSASADISNVAPLPVHLAWPDAGHVLLAVSASENLCFDTEARISIPSGGKLDRLPVEPPKGASADANNAEVQSLVDAKFPHRKAVVLGSDKGARRFLLVASGGSGPDRYFVLDRPNDLLYEVGRSESSK